jgi:hypothetical protein
LKLLTSFEDAYWNTPQNSFLCDWTLFSGADLSLAAGKMHKNNLSQAASGMILHNHRRLHGFFSVKTGALGTLKRVTGSIFKINK